MIRAIRNFMEGFQQEVANTRVNVYASSIDAHDDDAPAERIGHNYRGKIF